MSTFREKWKYAHGDPSVKLFDLAVQAGWIDLRPRARVLELGCCESDWHQWLKRADPNIELMGADVNECPGYNGAFFQRDASSNTPMIQVGLPGMPLPDAIFDAVVLLGALEHFGLGFYGDPVKESADIETVENAARWLKPGGFLYYDVPWTPDTHYVTENRHFRVYDDASLQARLTGPLRLEHQAWADGSATPGELLSARPDRPMSPFWYCARLLRKDA